MSDPRPVQEALERLRADVYGEDTVGRKEYQADLALVAATAQASARGDERAQAIAECVVVLLAQCTPGLWLELPRPVLEANKALRAAAAKISALPREAPRDE